MALETRGCIVSNSFGAAQGLMRIVAIVARQFSLAPQKTSGLPQPVYRADGFEFVVVPGAWRMVEGEHERIQRLTRNKRKWTAVEPHNRRRNSSAGSLHVTLHADLHA
jgi:uncharacterized protein YbdZ (MbtH family)